MREKKEINVLMGEEIRKAREAAGLTQEKFGEDVYKRQSPRRGR